MRCYLNVFRALAHNKHGRAAVTSFDLPPFIDASCRREPDLESEFPSISALCRGANFAPRLNPGDVVAYMTKKLVYPAGAPASRRLVAVLRILKSWRCKAGETGLRVHVRAASWYRRRGLKPPSNCMLPDSKPEPLAHTDGKRDDLEVWNRHYRHRAHKNGDFHACEPVFVELHDPPRLTDAQLKEWFGRLPGTRNPGALPRRDFAKLVTVRGSAP